MKDLGEKYEELEQEFLKYSDLKDIEIKENGEKFVIVSEFKNMSLRLESLRE